MRYGISWHQLVEWYQAYQNSPFGEERADLRNAIAGCAVANEVRAIGAGLAGKKIDPLEVKSLMINTDRARKGSSKAGDPDAGARAYAKSWEASIKRRLAEAEQTDQKPVKSKPKPRSKSPRRS